MSNQIDFKNKMNYSEPNQLSWLVRVFEHSDFDDPSKHEEILSQMPQYEEYCRNRLLALRQKIMFYFLKPCSDQPLINRDQEFHLLRKYNFFKYFAKKELENGQEAKAIEWLFKAKEPRDILIGANIRLAVQIVKKRKIPTNYFEDIISEAYILVNKCVDYFDWKYGTKLSTYITNSIQTSIGRVIEKCTKNDSYFVEISEESVRDFVQENHNEQEKAHEREEYFRLVKDEVDNLIKILENPRDQKIIKGFFLEEKTLEEIGESINLTKERVRQLRNKSLADIQKKLGLPVSKIDLKRHVTKY